MKNESRSRAKQSMANALVSNQTRDYWSEIKRSRNQRLSHFLLLMVNMHIKRYCKLVFMSVEIVILLCD